jgi:signal transduction histidine kinase
LAKINTLKQAYSDDRAIYIAATSGLFVIPHERSETLNQQIAVGLGHSFKYNATDNFFYYALRSRAICYFPDEVALFVSVKNSLFRIDKNGMKPFLFNNDQVHAASLAYLDHRLYIGTISNGMLILDKNGIQHISVQNGLFSKAIFKLKTVGKNLWIVGSGPLQVFNTEQRELVNNYAFPDRNASQMFDIDGVGETIYLASPTGLDNFPLLKNSADKKLKNYLLYIKVNNNVAAVGSSHKLSYEKNNVLFNIGVPAYLKAKDIYLKYALATKTDTTWLTTQPGERTIHFSSLMPGNYTLKAVAIDPRLGMADSMIQYDFTIEEPWWGGITFKIILGLILLTTIFYGYLSMLHKRIALKEAFDKQQQLIQAERQRISAEMHDDIGSGVFAIHRLADIAAKNDHASPEINQIKSMVDELSIKIREVIWTTSVGNDNLENLLLYTYFQINKLFEYSDINFVSEMPDDIPEVNITGQSRRNIYLLVKELVHNAIKHSQGTTVELQMLVNEEELFVAVNDDGVGIKEENGRPDSMGLGNIKSRVQKLNGKLSIKNDSGAHVSFTIPLSELRVIEFDKKLSKWQSFIMRFFKMSSASKQDRF